MPSLSLKFVAKCMELASIILYLRIEQEGWQPVNIYRSNSKGTISNECLEIVPATGWLATPRASTL